MSSNLVLTAALRKVITVLSNGEVPSATELYDEAIARIGNTALWCAERLRRVMDDSVTFTADHTIDTYTASEHCLTDDTPVRVSSSGTLPSGLSSSTTYYVINATDDTFQLSASVGGAAVAITTNGSGAHTLVVDGPTAIKALPSGGLTGATLRAQLAEVAALAANNVFTGTAQFDNLVLFATTVTFAGREKHRPAVSLADSDQTITVSQGDVFLVPDPAGARIITLGLFPTAPSNGERIRCTMPGPALSNSIEFKREGSGANMIAFTGGAEMAWADFQVIGGTWRCVGGGCDDGSFMADGPDY
jgi:hypothetical protein